MYFKGFFLVISILQTPLQAARILSIFGYPAPAQYAFIEPLLKELAARGHEITSISNYPQKHQVKNFRDILVDENKHLFDGYQNFSIDRIEENYYDALNGMYAKAFQMCLNIFNNPTVQKAFASEHFDLIILELFFTESFYGLSELLQAPIVGVSGWGTMISIDELVGNISPTSYIPNMILPLNEMNFWKRFLNVLVNGLEWSYYYGKYVPVQKQIYQKYFPTAKLSFEQAQRNFALVLLNDHFSLSAPRPYVPNMIEVAGLHINATPQPIPSSIREILDNAKEGVIFVETNFIISSDIANIFLKQFITLKQIILWKTNQVIVSPASNIYINSEFSQFSILAHANVKLAILQGGYPNAIESVYHGLPILGLIPSENADAYIDYMKRIGNGFTLKLDQITEKSFSKALNDLLSNSHYTNYAKHLSKIFRDQQTSPMERAVYWIEYVLRHDGAVHLRNMGQNLNWYQFYNIDVFILISHIIFLIIYLLYTVIRVFMKYCCKPICEKYKRN